MTHQELNSDVLVWSKAHQPLKYRPTQCLWREWVLPPSLLCPHNILPHSVGRDVFSQTSHCLQHFSHKSRWPLHQRHNPAFVPAVGNGFGAPRSIHSGQPKPLPDHQRNHDTLLHCLSIHACDYAELRKFSANVGGDPIGRHPTIATCQTRLDQRQRDLVSCCLRLRSSPLSSGLVVTLLLRSPA